MAGIGRKGRKPGKKRMTPAAIAANRANARKPRLSHLTKPEQEIRAAAREDMVRFLCGPMREKLKRALERIPESRPAWARLMQFAADRFGLPAVSEQTIRGEMVQAPRIVFEHRGFERPGSVRIPDVANSRHIGVTADVSSHGNGNGKPGTNGHG